MCIPLSLLGNGSVRNVSAATNTHKTVEELFPFRFFMYQKRTDKEFLPKVIAVSFIFSSPWGCGSDAPPCLHMELQLGRLSVALLTTWLLPILSRLTHANRNRPTQQSTRDARMLSQADIRQILYILISEISLCFVSLQECWEDLFGARILLYIGFHWNLFLYHSKTFSWTWNGTGHLCVFNYIV
jgi:hypothetical protein